jgi:hypothetical protein
MFLKSYVTIEPPQYWNKLHVGYCRVCEIQTFIVRTNPQSIVSHPQRITIRSIFYLQFDNGTRTTKSIFRRETINFWKNSAQWQMKNSFIQSFFQMRERERERERQDNKLSKFRLTQSIHVFYSWITFIDLKWTRDRESISFFVFLIL